MKKYIFLLNSCDPYVSRYDVHLYSCKDFNELKQYVNDVFFTDELLYVYDITNKKNLLNKL